MRSRRFSRSVFAWAGLFILAAGIFLSGCATGSVVRTERVDPSALQGFFDVILYGGRYLDDYETVAILIPVDGGYTFDVYAPEFDYKVRRRLPAAEASSLAFGFVSSHHAYARTVMSRIASSSGATAGYEIRPLYQRFVTGQEDVLDIFYSEQDMKITVKVSLKRWFRDQMDRDRPQRGIRR